MIAKSYKLFGKIYKVVHVDVLPHNWMGMADHTACKVYLLKPNTEFRPSRETIEHTYYHEVVHTMLVALGENKLSDDEAFVDKLAGCIHQFLQTSRY